MTTHVRISLLSSDSAQERAAKILTICGMTEGDPKTLSEIMQWMERCISDYMEVDGIANDRALDSFRSYNAAIAAIRRQREAGE